MTRVRPARPWAPIPASILILLVWWLVAHNSGSGWVQVLGDIAFGIVAIGIIGPAVTLWRARLFLVACPPDGQAGLPTVVKIRASTRLRVRPIEPPGPELMLGPVAAKRPADDELTWLPERRGVVHCATLEVATAAPFGLQWWARQVTMDLPSPLHVWPKVGLPWDLPQLEHDGSGEHGRRNAIESGAPRGVRRYQPGDRRRRVHWPATAHVGRLMVREMEKPAAEPLTLRLDLPDDPDSAERMAEQAFGTAIAALDRGTPLVLSTDEIDGSVTGTVDDRREAGRRLARATPKTAGQRAD